MRSEAQSLCCWRHMVFTPMFKASLQTLRAVVGASPIDSSLAMSFMAFTIQSPFAMPGTPDATCTQRERTRPSQEIDMLVRHDTTTTRHGRGEFAELLRR